MADFSEVMPQFARLCDSYKYCDNCPVSQAGFNCDSDNQGYSKTGAEELEHIIMAWAAEHPEPVYPTWGEYLISKGLLMPYWNEQGTAPYDMYIYAERALANHIPADIAQKLGIEPKEG